MTLDQCYQANVGKALLVPGGGAGNEGQCAQWADTVLHDVYGQPYVYTPGAIDWYLKAEQLGLTRAFDRVSDGSIKKGDFVIYGSGVGSVYGHIDLAAQDGSFSSYVGYDSNWGAQYNAQGKPILHVVNHSDGYNRYILGVLRLKGGTMPDLIPVNYLDALFRAFRGRSPVQSEIDKYANKVSFMDMIPELDRGTERETTAHALLVGKLAVKDDWEKRLTAYDSGQPAKDLAAIKAIVNK